MLIFSGCGVMSNVQTTTFAVPLKGYFICTAVLGQFCSSSAVRCIVQLEVGQCWMSEVSPERICQLNCSTLPSSNDPTIPQMLKYLDNLWFSGEKIFLWLVLSKYGRVGQTLSETNICLENHFQIRFRCQTMC